MSTRGRWPRRAGVVHAHFGGLAKVREASRIEDGAYVVERAWPDGATPPAESAA